MTEEKRLELIQDHWGLIVSDLIGGYLVAVPYTDTLMIRWSGSPWDAWWTKNRRVARKVARRVGGGIALFNRLTGDIREADHKIR